MARLGGIHQRLLRYEPDHGIFVTGVRALGRIGTGAALEALRELNGMRQGEPFNQTLAEVLSETDPEEAFHHYFSRLLQGSANAGVANEAAQRLMGLVDGASLEALMTLTQHPDLLVYRHALNLMVRVRTPEAAQALKALFLESHLELLGDRRLKEAMAEFRTLPQAAAFDAAGAALAALEAGPEDPVRGFYREVLAATQEGRSSQLGSLLQQGSEAMHLRARRLGFAVDAAAEGLAEMAARGQAEAREVLDLLLQAYRGQTGREGLSRAIARLAPAGDMEVLTLILGGPDAAQRAAALEVLGLRSDPALEPALLLACRDPLADIADRARHFVGRLPDAEDLASDLLHSGDAAEFQLGLSLVAENRFRNLVPDLLALLKEASREDLVVRAGRGAGRGGRGDGGRAAAGDAPFGPELPPPVRHRLGAARHGLGAGGPGPVRQGGRAQGRRAPRDRRGGPGVGPRRARARRRADAPGPGPPGLERPQPLGPEARLVVALEAVELDAREAWQAISAMLAEALAGKAPAQRLEQRRPAPGPGRGQGFRAPGRRRRPGLNPTLASGLPSESVPGRYAAQARFMTPPGALRVRP